MPNWINEPQLPDRILLHVLPAGLAAPRNLQVGGGGVVGIRVGRDGVGEYPAVDGPVQVPDEAHVAPPREGFVHLGKNGIQYFNGTSFELTTFKKTLVQDS